MKSFWPPLNRRVLYVCNFHDPTEAESGLLHSTCVHVGTKFSRFKTQRSWRWLYIRIGLNAAHTKR